MGIAEEVARLKQEKDAIILAHYYVCKEVQELADHVADSFKLAKIAAETDKSTIVFAGVEFMGESAKLLAPDKTVLMPEPAADCPMAHMMDAQTVEAARAEYGDDLAVVCYVNSTAEMKALSDVCVTSSNALSICAALPERNILFIPDMNLGAYIAEQLPDKHFVFNDGWCPIHQFMKLEEVLDLKERFPEAPVLAHPECNASIREEATYLGSTSGIIEAVVNGDAADYIVCTVSGVRHEIEARCAGTGKRIHFPATEPRCKNMDLITAEKVRDCLRDGTGSVDVPANPEAAKQPLARMLELAK